MSHTVTLKLQLSDPKCLTLASRALNLEHRQGPHSVKLFTSDTNVDFSVKLPGWRYPVGINTQSGEVSLDNYNGHWGDMKELHRLSQEYALQVAEQESSVQDLLFRGWSATRVQQPNGVVQLVLEGN